MCLLTTFAAIVLLLSRLLDYGMVRADVETSANLPASSDAFPEGKPMPKEETKCASGMFACGDFFGDCIREDQVCDGYIDCPGGADEENCENTDGMPSADEFFENSHLRCQPNEYHCTADNKCIQLAKVCDGVKDCSDGGDEDGSCGACQTYGCSDSCQEDPRGPKCICPEGMKLQVDGRTCMKEDHCSSNGHSCAHFCKPDTQTLSCICAKGYQTKGDYGCEPEDKLKGGYIYYISDDHSINRIPLFNKTSKPEEVVGRISENITSLAYDVTERRLFYAVNDHRNSKIMVIERDSAPKELLEGHGIRHIAFDWISKNIYYAADGVGLGVCNANGRYCAHLITAQEHHSGERLQTYGDIIVHPSMGIMIWTDFDPEHPNGIIRKAGLDGKEIAIVGEVPASKIKAIALDYVRDELYVQDGEGIRIVNLHSLQSRPFTHRIHSQAMLSFSGDLYHVERDDKTLTLWSAPANFDKRVHLSGEHFSLVTDNDLYYSLDGEHPCPGCRYMCVLSRPLLNKPLIGKCICPDKYSATKENRGGCALNLNADGPVRTASALMDSWCDSNDACMQGGKCKEGGYVHSKTGKHTTPACECNPGFSGLFCEIRPIHSFAQAATSKGPVVILLILLFGSLSIPLLFFLIRRNPDWLDRVRTALGLESSKSPIIPTFLSPKRSTPPANYQSSQDEAVLIQT